MEKEEGIFTKAFADDGIEVKYAEITSGADQTQALAAGDVQVLYAVGATSVILSAANHADIKVLNMYSRSPKAFCMYSKDESISSPEDLRGKTIAGPVGTNLHELLAAYLATADMTVDDVNFVNMGIPEAKAGLEGGSVDVALLAGAAAYQTQQQGYHLITDGEGLTIRYENAQISCAQCSVRDAVDVSVDVINESSYTIHESVQAYIQHEEADAYEPGYQLKGIQTVTLQPKETKRVTISLKVRDFAIITQEGECVVRPGSYRIAIGGQQPDARSAKLTGSDVAALVVRREGVQTPVEY